MNEKIFSITADALARKGWKGLPKEFVPSCAFVYSSPATLSYNSPGALGFGVKRAALAVPESVMLLVGPDCCGRNSTVLASEEGYSARMFYLRMSQSDLVTGAHIKKIPDAVEAALETAKPRPKVALVCFTCVDALLGSDAESACKKAAEKTGAFVVPCYMYALTREGSKPPMTAIRASIYSLLQRREKNPRMVNLIGFFSSLSKKSELFPLLKSMGIETAAQISECATLDEYMEMGRANFNLILDGESRFAAEELLRRTGTPYIELARLYDIDKIEKQYTLFASALGAKIETRSWKENARRAVDDFRKKFDGARFAVGQMVNASPYELSLSLCAYGFHVPFIIASPTEDDFKYLGRLARISPATKIFSPTTPSMALFKETRGEVDFAVGKDIADYFPDAARVSWNGEEQPFGFEAVEDFFAECSRAARGGGEAGA